MYLVYSPLIAGILGTKYQLINSTRVPHSTGRASYLTRWILYRPACKRCHTAVIKMVDLPIVCYPVYLDKQCVLEATCTQWAVDTLSGSVHTSASLGQPPAWPGQTLLVYAYTAIHIHASLVTTLAQGPAFKQPSTRCGWPPPPSPPHQLCTGYTDPETMFI